MKSILFCVLVYFSHMTLILGQEEYIYPQPIQECLQYKYVAAILHNDTILVEQFSPDAKPKLNQMASGQLSLAKVQLSETTQKIEEQLPFFVAVKNHRTHTIRMLTQQPVMSIDAKSILSECEQFDQIIIMTTDKVISLPHPIIDINWGC